MGLLDDKVAVVREIKALGGDAVADQRSVAAWDACERIVHDTVDRFGRLDVIVNNAGILRDRMITSMSEADLDAVIAVHLKGTFQMTKHACDHWRAVAKSGGDSRGRIVNTTSGTGLSGNIGQASYAGRQGGHRGADARHRAGDGPLRRHLQRGLARGDDAHVGNDRTRGRPGAAGVRPAAPTDDVAAGRLSRLRGVVVLSGQVLHVEGNTVIRMNGWKQSGDRYTARSGGFLEAEELAAGMRLAHRAFPPGLVSTLT